MHDRAFQNFDNTFLGLTTDEGLKQEVKDYLDNKTHSCAYLKVCANELRRIGETDKALVLEDIAYKKMVYEAKLMEAFGLKEDIRLNLNNVLIRAEEDVKFAKKIAELAKDKNAFELFSMMNELAKSEAANLAGIMGILNRVLQNN